MKIKIIDLFNQIANNEVVPKIIWYNGDLYKYDKDNKFYYNNNGISLYRGLYEDDNCLNDEAEIIEEDTMQENISKLNYQQLGTYQLDNNDNLGFIKALNEQFTKHSRKINEIIDYINRKENK